MSHLCLVVAPPPGGCKPGLPAAWCRFICSSSVLSVWVLVFWPLFLVCWNVTQVLRCQSGNTLNKKTSFYQRKLTYRKQKINAASFFFWTSSDTILRPSSVLPAVFPPTPSLPPALYLSAIRQIVAGLICIVSMAVPTGAPRSCSLKDSGASVPSHWPIPWIKLTLGQHQHIMNYGHLPLQTHCSLCSNVGNIERPGRLNLLTAYSLSYLLWGALASESGWSACVEMLTAWPLPRIQSIHTDEGVVLPRWGRLVTLVIFEESQGRVIPGVLSLALLRRMKPPPVTFFFKQKCTIRFSKGAGPDSDPTGIWLPRIIQPAIKHTVGWLQCTWAQFI